MGGQRPVPVGQAGGVAFQRIAQSDGGGVTGEDQRPRRYSGADATGRRINRLDIRRRQSAASARTSVF